MVFHSQVVKNYAASYIAQYKHLNLHKILFFRNFKLNGFQEDDDSWMTIQGKSSLLRIICWVDMRQLLKIFFLTSNVLSALQER